MAPITRPGKCTTSFTLSSNQINQALKEGLNGGSTCRLSVKISLLVDSRLKFSIFVGSRLNSVNK